MPNLESNIKSRRKWYQMSLRRFLVVVTLLSMLTALATMPRVMVVGFLRDANGRNIDRAYANTSTSFQGYVSRNDFDEWLNHTPKSLKLDAYGYGFLALDDDWNPILNLDALENSERLEFVWEGFGWKFKHMYNHW